MSRIPVIPDATAVLQAATTKTASFDGPAFDMGEGYAPSEPGQPAAAIVEPTAVDRTTGDETYQFTLQESADGSTGWSACGAAVSVTATGGVLAKGFITKRFVRLSLVAAGTTPSITYSASLAPLN